MASSLQPPGAAEQLLKAYYYAELLNHEPFTHDLLAVYQCLAELWRHTRTRTGPGSGCGGRMDDPGWRSLGGSGLLALARADGRAARAETGFAETCGAWAKAWAGTSEPLVEFGQQAARAWLQMGAGHLTQTMLLLAERARALWLVGQQAIVHAFTRRWPLPADAEQDIATSFAVWHQLGRPGAPILLPAPLAALGAPAAALDQDRLERRALEALAGLEALRLDLAHGADAGESAGDGDGDAPPSVPLAPWHPLMGRPAFDRRVRAVLRQVEVALVEERRGAEAALRQHGWAPRPPAWHSPEALAQAARRLVLRAVHRLSWSAIAARTGATSRSTVAEQVTAWVRQLNIRRL